MGVWKKKGWEVLPQKDHKHAEGNEMNSILPVNSDGRGHSLASSV